MPENSLHFLPKTHTSMCAYVYVPHIKPKPCMLNKENLKAMFYYIICLIASCIFNVSLGSNEVRGSADTELHSFLAYHQQLIAFWGQAEYK